LRVFGSVTHVTSVTNCYVVSQLLFAGIGHSESTRKLSSIEDRGQTDDVFTLTCHLQFQSPANHGIGPHICKRLRPKISWFERQSAWNRRTDRQADKQTDGGGCTIQDFAKPW